MFCSCQVLAAAAAAAADKDKKSKKPSAVTATPQSTAAPASEAFPSEVKSDLNENTAPSAVAAPQEVVVVKVDALATVKKMKDTKLAGVLASSWQSCEQRYTTGVRSVLRLEREARWQRVQHFASLQRNLIRVMQSDRNDSKQAAVSKFQGPYLI